MEPIFIYYIDLKFDKHKKFTISFSNEDSLRGVVFRKNRDYYITSMTKVLRLAKASGSNTTFRADKSRQSKYIERVEFFNVESKKTKEIYIYSTYK